MNDVVRMVHKIIFLIQHKENIKNKLSSYIRLTRIQIILPRPLSLILYKKNYEKNSKHNKNTKTY